MHRNPVTALATIATLLLAAPVLAQTVSTLTGPFHASGDIAVDAAGNICVADYGDALAGGVYSYTLETGGRVWRDKVVLVK
jgi:hypothetical protein